MTEATKSIWLSSGTAALIASLEAVGAGNKVVAVPPNVCPNVVAAVVAVGATPFFIDIEPSRQGMDPKVLSTCVGQVDCVIAVHAYGVPCDIGVIADIARAAKVPLIEDCAQADGASFEGTPVGEYGDIAVFSFGTGKILDAGGGGLAQLKDAGLHEKMLAAISGWSPGLQSPAGDALSQEYKRLYNAYYPEIPTEGRAGFLCAVQSSGPAFMLDIEHGREKILLNARAGLPEKRARRLQKHGLYYHLLSGCPLLEPMELPQGGVPWRFNVLLPETIRDSVFRALLKRGVKASTWYPDMTRFLPVTAYRASSLNVARCFDAELLNLWLDDLESDADIAKTAGILLQECEVALAHAIPTSTGN